jgi:hypothetical protein
VASWGDVADEGVAVVLPTAILASVLALIRVERLCIGLATGEAALSVDHG